MDIIWAEKVFVGSFLDEVWYVGCSDACEALARVESELKA